MKPGIHTLPSAAYHADPCEPPSLSASIAHLLCSQSPAHARTAHPRLNPDYRRQEEERFDVGSVAHALLLEGITAVEVVDADDWRTKAAKEARDAARDAGRIPLLARHWSAVEEMVAAARTQLGLHAADPPMFTDGEPEQTLVWEEPGGVVCRSRLDWLRTDRRTIDDFKTTSRSANPEQWSRSLYGQGADIQAAFYVRGVQELTGETPEFRWAVQETFPPYALTVLSPAPDVLTIAQRKVEHAIDTWRRCLETGHWPAYPTDVCYAELPPWEEYRWLERELQEEAA